MDIDNLIALIGILISAIVAYFTSLFTIKQERKKGKVILLELVIKYLSNFSSCWDYKSGKIKDDPIEKL